MAGNKVWRIRDAVHNLIEFDEIDPLERRLWRVIQTPAFQRLRRIKQLGFSEFVYPGATHTRFAHSIGVFHAARRLVGVIKKFEARNQACYEEQHAAPALAAALLHDIGHGMFSHAFEAIGEEFGWAMAKHEDVSQRLIREGAAAEILNEYYDGFAANVAEIIKDNKDKQIPPNIFHALVSSQFDADRLDYMQRDRLMTGVRSSYVDMEWLLANLEVGDVPVEQDGETVGEAQTLILGVKAKQTAENYIFSLFHLYPNIYLHKTTRGFEMLFQALLRRLVFLADAGNFAATGLAETHPLLNFIRIEQSKVKQKQAQPAAAANKAEIAATAADNAAEDIAAKSRADESLEHVLALDDNILWGSLHLLMQAPDAYIKKCAAALTLRQPLRAINIWERVRGELADKDVDRAEDIVSKASESVLTQIEKKYADSDRPVFCDSYTRPLYKRAKKDEANAYMTPIWVRDCGKARDIWDLSPAISHAEPYSVCCAYLFRDGQESRFEEEINKFIAKEVSDNA